MRNRNRAACRNTSLGMGKGRPSHPRRLIAESLAAFRRMVSALEEQSAGRDRVWPRNYGCWIRAP